SSKAYKKKGNVAIDDLFPESNEAVEDLFSDEPAATQPAASTSSATQATTTTKPRKKLSTEERGKRLQKLIDFVKPRLGREPTVKLPQIRNSAWVQLIGLANTKEELAEVVELFPGWRDIGREFNSQFSELFVRRCEELSCPLLALDVFGDYAKYNLKLTLPGGRQLLHSLHDSYPIDKVITASALYSIYSLTPIAQDLVSCSMIVSACFKHNSKDSLQVAHALVPHLQRLLKQTKPTSANNKKEATKEKPVDKSQAWLQWTLKKIDRALFVQNHARAEWLRDWRMRNGQLLEPTRF
ncbi:hypothetical protein AMATHDRAFT_151051, partial [Amanita thiersii Skay4041]